MEPDASDAHSERGRRFALAAVSSAVIAVVFATVGDGVSATDETGWQWLVVEHFHTITWTLLACSFATAAAAGRWSRPANVLAVLALACYLTFLAVAFLL